MLSQKLKNMTQWERGWWWISIGICVHILSWILCYLLFRLVPLLCVLLIIGLVMLCDGYEDISRLTGLTRPKERLQTWGKRICMIWVACNAFAIVGVIHQM